MHSVTGGRNWAKSVWNLFVLFLRTACQSTVISEFFKNLKVKKKNRSALLYKLTSELFILVMPPFSCLLPGSSEQNVCILPCKYVGLPDHTSTLSILPVFIFSLPYLKLYSFCCTMSLFKNSLTFSGVKWGLNK